MDRFVFIKKIFYWRFSIGGYFRETPRIRRPTVRLTKNLVSRDNHSGERESNQLTKGTLLAFISSR
jgi:hypothetical protein